MVHRNQGSLTQDLEIRSVMIIKMNLSLTKNPELLVEHDASNPSNQLTCGAETAAVNNE